MPTYVCPSFLSTSSLSLSLLFSTHIPPSASSTRSHTHPRHPKRKGREQQERETKRERRRKFTDFKNRPDFPPLWNCLGCAPSRRLTATLSLLLPPPLSSFNLAPYYLRLLRLPPLASSFLQNWTARWNSQFATSILRLSPPLSLSLSLRERGLSQTHPLLENARFLSRILFHRGRNLGQTRARREEKKGRRRTCRFRTILERSISYERCRSPLAYKTFIKSPTKWTGGRRRRCTRGRQAAAGCQMILKLFGTVSTANHPSSIRSHHQPPLLESFRTPMAAWPG